MGKSQTFVEFVSNAKKLIKDIGGVDKAMGRLGAGIERHSRAFRNAGLVMAAGLGAAAKVAGDFDQQLANMNSVAEASQQELAKIRHLALKLGGATIHGPRKLAEATYWLASAGQKAGQMMKTLPGLARLATATQHELGATTTIVVGALNAFNYAADETDRIANALAASIGGSQGNMDKFGQSLSSVGAVAGGFGRDIEEVLAPLAKLYDANIEASVAGTSLKTMYLALLAPNAQLIKFTERTGIALGELDPRTRSLTDILATLVDKGFDAADSVAAFGRESATAASVLLGVGSPALREFQTEITGTDRAMQMAEGQQKGFNNQMKLFRSSLEELGIELGTNLLEPLTAVTAKLRDLVSATSDWSPEAKAAVVNTGLWATASVLLLSIYDKLAPKVVAAAKAVKWLGAGLAKVPWAAGITGALVFFRVLHSEMGTMEDIDWGTPAFLDWVNAVQEQGPPAISVLSALAASAGEFWDAAVPPPDAVEGVASFAYAIEEAGAMFRKVVYAATEVEGAVKTMQTAFQDTTALVDTTPMIEGFLALVFHAHDASAAIRLLQEDFGQFLLTEAPNAASAFMSSADALFADMAEKNGKFFGTLKKAAAVFLKETLMAYAKQALGALLIQKIKAVGTLLMEGTFNWSALAKIPVVMAAYGAAAAGISQIKSFAKGGVVTESGQFTGMFDKGDMIVGPDRIAELLSGKGGGGGTNIEAHIHVHGDLAMSKGELDDSLSGFADRLALQMG